ncbi:MAG: phosphoglycolate phosphatase [Vicingaceae bacterium]|nr:phosphoglycolate phosphatase [Vicingaceae bacterium]
MLNKIRLKDKTLLIFDLDGTLINSIPDLGLAINKMLDSLDVEPIPLEKITTFIGNGSKTLVLRSLRYTHQGNVSEELFDIAFPRFMRSYKANPCEKTLLYPGVKETLQYLKDQGYKMVICTNKPIEFVEPILEKLDLKKYFHNWIGENSLNEKKPSGLPLLHLAKEANIPIDKCLMIGDSNNDILSATNAQMESIGLSYGYNYDEDITKYSPTIVLDKFTKLKKIL